MENEAYFVMLILEGGDPIDFGDGPDEGGPDELEDEPEDELVARDHRRAKRRELRKYYRRNTGWEARLSRSWKDQARARKRYGVAA
ncbi:hypothetical protein KJ910_05075 [Patescibacteria group bacterium]|nr:hypothetical protein [Patescibacteria group bacterium]MBU1906573.1 hypothetical protein [Patescibacteria group bacterium]